MLPVQARKVEAEAAVLEARQTVESGAGGSEGFGTN